MKESITSLNLLKLNKRYLDLYYSVGVYEERNNIKKITSIICKYLKGKRFRELLYLARGYFNRSKEKREYEGAEISSAEFPDNIKVVIYTCILGNYDTIKEPMYINEKCCDFVAVTDFELPQNSSWKRKDISDINMVKNLSSSMKNRYVKLHPHKIFPEYDYSVYIDGSITVIADVMPLIGQMINSRAWLGVHNLSNGIDCVYDEAVSIIGANKAPKKIVQKQIKAYKRVGYPRHNGVFENAILIRQHNNVHCKKVMRDWWEQLLTYSQRDQMSLNYVLWKNNVPKEDTCILGDNLYMNPRFYWEPHKNYNKSNKKKEL